MTLQNSLPPRFDEIKPYLDDDRSRGITTPIIRHLIATTVSRSAKSVYGKAFSTKCTQSSVAVKHLLSRVGIKSQLIAGAVCYLRAEAKTGTPNMWSGFWGSDHHAWVFTEFEELVDISISALNEHPCTTIPELAPPALWWPVNLGSPHFFRYLSDLEFQTLEFEGSEQVLFKKFMEMVDSQFDQICQNLSPNDFHYPNLLGGDGELGRLIDEQHPYLTVVINETHETTPLPNWIIDRQNEMQEAIDKGVPAKSRLIKVKGLFESRSR